MAKLTMWLNVVPPGVQNPAYGVYDLWTRDVETICVPGLDDQVTLWPDEDGSNGPLWSVKRRYMGHDGVWHVELFRMLVDPPEELTDQILNAARRTTWERTSSTWYTQRDGAPEPLLDRGGWRRY